MLGNIDMTDKIREECAVIGTSLKCEEAAGVVYNGLLALQHRGQEGAGIALSYNQSIIVEKDIGLVNEVLTEKVLATLPKAKTAIGHARYSTTGSNTIKNVQPFLTEYLTGRIATAHNGNITNAKQIRSMLEKEGLDFSATSDSEVVSSLIAYNVIIQKDLIKGVVEGAKILCGAFSLVLMTGDKKLVAVRDPHGFRPLCIGKNEYGIAVASESCALDSCGFDFVRDVKPGEVIIVENGDITYSNVELTANKQGLCIFEYVYFARPDSIIDKLSVYEARFNMGRMLAIEHPVEADVVCGVPDSGLEAAMGYAYQSGIPLVSGFVKNRYIGRSFIYPSQLQREHAVKIKLNPLRATIEGKRIVLVDDSIVRGTTSAKIISSLRSTNVKQVHMRISSPPFRHTCHFGTDIDNEKNLIANQLSIDEICQRIGADSLGFISVEGLKKACSKSSLPFCTGCFNNDYGTNSVKMSKYMLEE
jgi:amidophosphoribosyltransferase